MLTQNSILEFRAQWESIQLAFSKRFSNELDKYSREGLRSGNELLKAFSVQFEQNIELLRDAKPEIERFLRTEAPDFNIFTILGLERYEVLTHTPFLACLLSPAGPHGQGSLFLKCFLTHVLGFSQEDAIHPAWYVMKESEFIDLRIANEALHKAVFIENKIDTHAHSGQLSRYFALWKSRYIQGAFVYLTPDGIEPPDEGFDDKIWPREDILRELTLLSYRHHIARWLQVSLGEIQSPKVSTSVAMYISLLENLL